MDANFVFSGYSNVIIWRLEQAVDDVSEPVNLLPVTRMVLEFTDGTVIDSDISAVFDWSIGSVMQDDPNCGKLILSLGNSGLITPYEYTNVRLIVYGLDGLERNVWADNIAITTR